MASKSEIEWTETTWNPVTGCTKISDGCEHCYAERMAKRLKAMGNIRYKKGFQVNLHPDVLNKPFHWKKPRLIFVNSMSDLFHEKVPEDFIIKTFEIMEETSRHIYQVLTKRTYRLTELSKLLPWSKNIWQGVTVENEKYISRIDDLRKTPAKIKFISFEPLIGKINIKKLNLDGIDWVIVGGESGPGARPMKKEWVLQIRNKCLEENIPFFFKQWGGFHRKENGRELNGKTWDEYPKAVNSLNNNIKDYYS